LAFHPDFSSNGFFFFFYIDLHGNTVIARYKAASGSDTADASSATLVLTFDQPFGNHNGGQLAFGPDGFLYISTGDGGGGGGASNNAQNLGSPLGKILRIDVDKGSSYAIPSTNPFVNRENVKGEIWVYGLRNPWRFSFDRQTNALFIGDVGQENIEEIDLLPGNSRGGENFGWRLMEGSECFNPSSGCNDGALQLPILEYSHAGANCSVVGGYRYRGKEFPFMDGIYFFGDFCSGRIWGAGNEQGSWEMRQLLDTSLSISTFGEDEKGETYIGHLNSGQNDNGSIYRLKRVIPFPQ
jgi:glucose/arabinose dehydrogenase